MTFKVTIGNTGQIIACAGDRTILSEAILAGIDYPYGCASGNCGMCMSELKAGAVDLKPYGDGALSARQKANGFTLACRALPTSDVEVVWLARARPA